jgi:hypothetical protein
MTPASTWGRVRESFILDKDTFKEFFWIKILEFFL